MSLIIGPQSPVDTAEMPAPHPAILRSFVNPDLATAAIRFFPVNLDLKQAEAARCVLLDGRRSCMVERWGDGAIPIFLSTDPQAEELFCRAKPAISVFIDLHDKGRKFDFLGMTDPMWQSIDQNRLQVIYLKLQVHDATRYAMLNRSPERLHALSWPMLLGGSRFHVTVSPDFDGDRLFSRTLRPNPVRGDEYNYDWSCVGSVTCDDRRAAFALLEQRPSPRGFLIVSRPGHEDAMNATVPLEKYLDVSRRSKLSISLNGRGPWCLKDGELFSNNCFILRQWHPILELNPLSPRDGVHWRVFKTENICQTIDQCVAEENSRERIRQDGFSMFQDAMTKNLWSNKYIDCLMEFLRKPAKSAWGRLAFA